MKKLKQRGYFATRTAGLLAVVAISTSANAAVFTWSPSSNAGQKDWSTAGNFSPSAPANNGTADLIFTGGFKLNNNMQANYNIAGLSFGAGASAFTIGNSVGTTLTIQGNGITNNSSLNQIINISSIAIGSSQTWSATSGALTFGGSTISLGANTLNISGANNVSIANAISGAGTLTKSGTGILTLSGNSTHTIINGGTVNVTGSHAGAVVVNSDGTLLGTGNITGGMTLNSGASLNPGASVGILNAGSSLWNGGATYNFEINNAVGSAGTAWDLVNITGGLSLGASSGNPFAINIFGDLLDFDSATGYSWTIASASGGITGFDASAFNIITDNFANSLDGGTFVVQLLNSDQDLVLSFVPVPEPSTIALGVMGGLALIGTAFRRRK